MSWEGLRGVVVPLVTPFDEHGKVDRTGVQALVDFLVARGVHGLFPAGTTGEGPLLDMGERRTLAEAVVEAATGRVPVIVHTGALTTDAAVELTQHAQAIGAHAAALIPPYYYRLSEEALLGHFRRVAESVPDFPLYLYQYPGVTGYGLTPTWIERLLACCPNVVGIKDSSGSLDLLAWGTGHRNGRFHTANGSDALFLPALALGVDACVSGNANVVPELTVCLYRAVQDGDLAQGRALQQTLDRVRRLLRDGHDLSLFKGLLARRGVPIRADVRPPLLTATPERVEACWQALCALALPGWT